MALVVPILTPTLDDTITGAQMWLRSVWVSTPPGQAGTLAETVEPVFDDQAFQAWLTDTSNAADITDWWVQAMVDTGKLHQQGTDEFNQQLWRITVDKIGSTGLSADPFDFNSIETIYINKAATAGSTAGRSSQSIFPAVLEQLLRSRGLVEGVRAWDPGGVNADGSVRLPGFSQVPVVDEEAVGLLHEAGKAYFANQIDDATQQLHDTSGWDWEQTSEAINKLPTNAATTVWEMAFPQEAQNYYTIRTTNTDGTPGKAVAVPAGAVERMRSYLEWLDVGQLHSAMIAGVEADVPWENILLVADALNQLDPIVWGEAQVDDTTGAVGPQPPTVSPQSTVLTDIAARLKEGLRLYDNDEAFAILHAVNPTVARTIRADGAITNDDVQTAQDALKSYMGFTALPNSPAASWTAQHIMNLEASPPEPAEEREVSEAEVRESYRELYKSWFMADPTDDELDKFSDYFDDALSTYQRRALDARPNRFDLGDYEPVGTGEFERGVELTEPKLKTGGFIEGQPALGPAARDYLRADDMYGQLYSKKPSGMTEEGYLGIMQESSTGTLGRTQGALAQGSIRAGMISGDPESVGRHAVYSGAGAESATLRGRMAKAGNILRRMT